VSLVDIAVAVSCGSAFFGIDERCPREIALLPMRRKWTKAHTTGQASLCFLIWATKLAGGTWFIGDSLSFRGVA
jgi:hypothetical protein